MWKKKVKKYCLKFFRTVEIFTAPFELCSRYFGGLGTVAPEGKKPRVWWEGLKGQVRGGIGRLPIYMPELLYCTALLSTHEQARGPNIYIRYYFIRSICAMQRNLSSTPTHLIPRFIVFFWKDEIIILRYMYIFTWRDKTGEYYIL